MVYSLREGSEPGDGEELPKEGGRAPLGRGKVEKEFPWKVEELHREGEE